jgi:Tol biopolymer transport system component
MTKTSQLKVFAAAAVAALALCLLTLVAAQPAEAAFPGKNGQISFDRSFRVWVTNPNLGSGEAKLRDDGLSDSQAAYSPDGSRVAFVRNSPGPEIYVTNANGTGTPVRLTNNTVVDRDPAWSHDGTRIAFNRGGQVWMMNADGTDQKQLTIKLPTDSPEYDPTAVSLSPSWSVPLSGAPDGKIVFVHQGRLWTMLADGNGKAELSYTCPTENGGFCDRAVGNPTFSPDGSEIAAEYYGDIFMVASGGGISRMLLPGPDNKYPGQERNPAWSPDGTKIAFEHNGNIAGSASGIYMANADGSSTQATLLTSKTGEVNPDWQQDSISPQTTITSGPTGFTNDGTPTFSFSGTDNGSASAALFFSYKVDGGAWSDYSSNTSATLGGSGGLGDGKHTFYVMAKDAAGNVDVSPAQRTFTVDTRVPAGTVSINGGAAYTKSTAVKLSLSATDPSPASGVAAMRFSYNGTSWSGWQSYATSKPWTLTSGDGTKTVHVQFRDRAGNVSTTVRDTIKLDTTPPSTTITSGPSAITRSTSAKFGFSSEAGARFQCSLDGAAFTSCSSPKGYTTLKNGRHTFKVRAIDAAGNVDATPAARVWTVDTIKPTTGGMSPRHTSVIRDTTPTIKATVKDNLTNLQKSNIRLYVNGVLISPTKYSYSAATDQLLYNSPKLGKGKKTVKIVATDRAGNVGARSWYFKIR